MARARTRHAHRHDGHHVGVPPVDVLQQARELQLVRGVADLGEATQLAERLHIPVAHLRVCEHGQARKLASGIRQPKAEGEIDTHSRGECA